MLDRGLKNKEAYPKPALENNMDKQHFRRFPVHARGEMYIVFDEESDFQVENMETPHFDKSFFSISLFLNRPCRLKSTFFYWI